MIIKKVDDVKKEKIEVEGVRGVIKQRILAPEDGAPTFTLRKFTVEPGGCTFHHTHDFEHEIYVLQGSGIAIKKDEEVRFEKDYAILVEPNEIHQFINNSDEELVFLCIIPNQ